VYSFAVIACELATTGKPVFDPQLPGNANAGDPRREVEAAGAEIGGTHAEAGGRALPGNSGNGSEIVAESILTWPEQAVVGRWQGKASGRPAASSIASDKGELSVGRR
jgi:hypothetical protein